MLYIIVYDIDQMPSAQFIWRNFFDYASKCAQNTQQQHKFVYLKENRIKYDKKNSSGNIQRHREKKRTTKKSMNILWKIYIPCSRISIWSEEKQNNNNKKMEIANANWQRWQQVNIKIAESTYFHAPHLRSYISPNLNPNAMLLAFGFCCVCVFCC